MELDLGYLGSVVLGCWDKPYEAEDFFVVMDGYTETGIRVHGIILKAGKDVNTPDTWKNAIIINVGEMK